jgi:hypothetical protein
MVNSASKFDHHAAWRRPSLAQERAAHAGHADLHRRELRPGRSVLRSIILPEHAGIISDAVPMLIVGRASRAWRGGRLGRCGHAAARPDSAYVGSWSMDAGRRSACMSMKKECVGERAVSPVLLGVCRAVAGNSLWAACIAASSYAMWAASAREHSLM